MVAIPAPLDRAPDPDPVRVTQLIKNWELIAAAPGQAPFPAGGGNDAPRTILTPNKPADSKMSSPVS
jgi:hypothetical protein